MIVKRLFHALLFLMLLFFSVFLHAQVKVKVIGASTPIQQNVLAHLGEISREELKSKDQLDRRIISATQKATRAMGYYQAEVEYQLKRNALTLFIALGEPVRLVQPEIQVTGEAASFSAVINLLDNVPFKEGEVLEHGKYDQFKNELLKICQSKGFLEAKYQQSILLVDLKELSAKVKLSLDTGGRYTIGQIQFEGSQLKEELLLRIAPFSSGDDYDAEQFLLFRRSLADSNYFQSVTVNQNINEEDRVVDIVVRLIDAKQHQYDIGIGYSTDTGPRAKLRWEQPQLNKKGHSSHVEVNWSKPLQEVTGRYVIPLEEPLTHFLQFDTGWQRKEVEDAETQLTSVGTLLTSIDELKWRTDYSLDLDNERYKVGEEPTTTVLYLIPGVAWSKTFLPTGIDPLTGSRYWVGLSASGENLGSDTNFFKAHGLVKWLVSLGNDNSLLTIRLEGGAVVSEDITQVPISQRFFTGGDQSVRGYKFETLAPRNENGELVGGRFLNVGSLEFSHRFLDEWRGALFVDTGRAYNEPSKQFSTGVGVGVRWLSPIGQIRLDLAFPLDNDENDADYQIHISMGPPL